MKLGDTQLDDIDRRILVQLQEDCKVPLAQIGRRVGLSAPSVMERIRRLEEAGIISGYSAQVVSRRVGLDVTAFIGISMAPEVIAHFESQLEAVEEVQECHHVTGAHTMMLKVKTQNTQSLERLISRLRLMQGVLRSETLVVLSTRMERTRLPLGAQVDGPLPAKRAPGTSSKESKTEEVVGNESD